MIPKVVFKHFLCRYAKMADDRCSQAGRLHLRVEVHLDEHHHHHHQHPHHHHIHEHIFLAVLLAQHSTFVTEKVNGCEITFKNFELVPSSNDYQHIQIQTLPDLGHKVELPFTPVTTAIRFPGLLHHLC